MIPGAAAVRPPAPVIDYWLSVASPWAWLGSARFIALARQHGAAVEVLPIELGRVFSATGGKPFLERPEARRSYRQLELERWSRHLGVPIRLEPRFYPVDRQPASRLLIAARIAGADALALSHAVLRAIWVEDRDIADDNVLATIATQAGLTGAALVEQSRRPEIGEVYASDTQRAIAEQVFGAPTYVIHGERFWGQDRLDLVAARLDGRCVQKGGRIPT